MDEWMRVGVITNTHGIKGEVKVFPTTDDVKRFLDLKSVVIDCKGNYLTCEISNVKFFKNLVILKFKEFDDINEIEKFKGLDLLINRKDAVACEENEYFICDVIGATVKTQDGEEFGVLKEVLTTAANDVFVVETKDKKEALLPVIPSCVLDMDIEKKEVTISIMPGLLD